MQSNREEISFQDLHAVLDAARLLRRYNLISVEQVRNCGQTVTLARSG